MAPDMPPNPPMPWTAASGKEAVPQRHAHEHEPSAPTEPVPVVRPVAEAAATEARVVPAAAAATEVAATAATEVTATGATEATIAPAEPVPFAEIAFCSNMAWVLLAVGLMEKVMPLPQ